MRWGDHHAPRAPLDEFGSAGGGYAGSDSSGGSAADEGADTDRIRKHLANLSAWARNNEKEAFRDLRRYWMFKLPALLASAVTGSAAVLNLAPAIVAILGITATVFIGLDGLWPTRMLYNTRKRAVHRIRRLMADTETAIDRMELAHPAGSADRLERVLAILDDLQTERATIASELELAESSLGTSERGA